MAAGAWCEVGPRGVPLVARGREASGETASSTAVACPAVGSCVTISGPKFFGCSATASRDERVATSDVSAVGAPKCVLAPALPCKAKPVGPTAPASRSGGDADEDGLRLDQLGPGGFKPQHRSAKPSPTCLKGSAACVQRGSVKFSGGPVVVSVYGEHWNFVSQVIPSATAASKTRLDPFPPDMAAFNLKHFANARRKAVDLADGVGLLDDPEDTKPWEGVPCVSKNEVRRKPLLWEGDVVLRFVDDLDGQASYGRPPAFRVPAQLRKSPSASLHKTLNNLGRKLTDFELLGDVPADVLAMEAELSKRKAVPGPSAVAKGSVPLPVWKRSVSVSELLGEKVDLHLGAAVCDQMLASSGACMTVKRSDLGAVVKLWLHDTGCGHDLVGQAEVKHLQV